ncbi:MAG: glycosyltransferase family 2 protein [Acidimicrobiales bacterium]
MVGPGTQGAAAPPLLPPSGPGPSVAVVIPTFRRPGGLDRLVGALEAQTLPRSRFEVVVVDDCSGDGTRDRLEELSGATPLRLHVLATAANGGPAAARNLGWRHSQAPVVAFLDDDCLPEPGWLEAGLAAMSAGAEVGIVQGRTAAPAGTSVWGLEDWYLYRVIDRPSPFLEGCNIFYRRPALEAVGGFDEDIGYGEDTSLGWQVLDQGWERRFAAGAVVRHVVERRGWGWFLRTGLEEGNLVLLAHRHPGFRAEAFWMPWAYRREDAALALGLAGLVAARWWRPAVAAVVPYLWLQRPSLRRRSFARLCLQRPVVDAARLAAKLRASARHRTLVL